MLFSRDGSEPFEQYKSSKFIHIEKLQSSVKIDGILQEACWKEITPITDFLQEEPHNMKQPSERTEVKIGYDNDAIYFGVRLFDSNPTGIKKQLSDYDDWFEGFEGKSDWFAIEIDSHHDHQSAFAFVVNASGVQADYMVYDDESIDDFWDSVWSSHVNVDELGWSIEYRIPFSVLRFIEIENMQWGINFIRYIQRKNETDTWVTFPRGTKGIVSQYGHLTGIKNVTPQKNFEFKPYILEGMSSLDYYTLKSDYSGNEITADNMFHKKQNRFMDNTGLDLKYYVTQSAVIDLTLNPDFGQIEADPNDINLTAYETYLDENRPFFMENASQFYTPLEIFYSRRIGDYGTSILGAGKLTGKTQYGLSYNILGALTSDSTTSIQEQLAHGNRDEFYNGRIQYDILDGNSNIGIFATHYSGEDTLNNTKNSIISNVQSLDGMINLFENKFAFDFQFVSSSIKRNIDYSGYGISTEISYKTPEHFTLWIEYEKLSDSLNFDYSGFMERNNIEKLQSGIKYRTDYPIDFIKNASADIQFKYAENLQKDVLDHSVSFHTSIEFQNYWATRIVLVNTKSHFDDLMTWEDNNHNGIYNFGIDSLGFVLKVPETRGVSTVLSTDIRKPLYAEYSVSYVQSEINDWGREHALVFNYNPTESFQLEVGASQIRAFEKFRFLNNGVKPKINNGNIPTRIVPNSDAPISLFSESHNFIDIFDFRIEKSFNKQLSLSMYSEFYTNFNNLEQDSTQFTFIDEENNYQYPISCFGDYDESNEDACDDEFDYIHPQNDPFFYTKYASFISNFVLRWEFSRGSSMYVVYSKSKFINGKRFTSFNEFIDFKSNEIGVERYDIESLFVKFDYWFDI